MYSNLEKHGGSFSEVLSKELLSCQNVNIATGYTSTDILQKYSQALNDVTKKGGCVKLLLGMAFYEGVSQKKKELLLQLNQALSKHDDSCGVFVSHERRYHGKIYLFDYKNDQNIYVGSSNFSRTGISTNVECMIDIHLEKQKKEIIAFLDTLYSPDYALKVDKADLFVPQSKKVIAKTIQDKWRGLKKFDSKNFVKKVEKLPSFTFSLSRIVEKERSNLNVYFGKGRENKKGIVKPRPWYEIELIAEKNINRNPLYPQGDFLAFTDTGIIIPMRTQGTYYKNIRSRKSLQLFGLWLKGKLEDSGALKKYELITQETLLDYGKDAIIFYKKRDGEYYLEF